MLTVALVAFAVRLIRSRAAGRGQLLAAAIMLGLLATQILLGAYVIWKQRHPTITTLHVIVGAATLATTFILTWTLHRDQIDGRADPSTAGQPQSSPARGRDGLPAGRTATA